MLADNGLTILIGWWFVDLDGYLGWVPASYLKPRDDIEEDPIVEAFESGRGLNLVSFVLMY